MKGSQVAYWSRAWNSDLKVASSNPLKAFWFFLQFSQTLRANFWFQRSLAIEDVCLSFSTGFKLPPHVVRVHGIWWHLYIIFIWKLSVSGDNFTTFFSFFASKHYQMPFTSRPSKQACMAYLRPKNWKNTPDFPRAFSPVW